jgi:putative ABC transport system permease protein
VVRTLRKKLARDLWRLRYQALTIAVLVGCGIASLVAAVAASASMQASRDAFYRDTRFGNLFDHLERAPRAVLDRLRDLPGVSAVDGRVVGDFRLEMDGSSEPVSARFVSLAWPQEERLNQPRIRTGRLVQLGSADEIVVSEAFAEAWGLTPGAAVTAVINQRRAMLRIVGVAVSPEYAIAMAPRTGLPDPLHFGIVWMDEDALATATNLVGAFNDVTLELGVGADEQESIRRVDQILEPYGGLGVVGRADQPSAKLTEQKIDQLGKLARTLPVVFLGIASFLLHVLLSRIVGTQREQIATLKALGYRTSELAGHYLELAAVICAFGVVFGVGLGAWGAHGLLIVYARYFKFPAFLFRFHAWAIALAVIAAFASGLGGTLLAVRRTVSAPPAEAMRPEAPPSYRPTVLDRIYRWLSPIVRMVLRDVQRKPVRLLLSATSIALATAIVVAGSVFGDSISDVLRLQFEVSHREAITVTLDQARPWRAVGEVAHIPGVLHAEGERMVPVRLRAAHRSRTTSILGLWPAMDLHQLLDTEERPLTLPAAGLSLSRVLGESLGVRAGDPIEIDVLESDRRKIRVPIATLIDDLLGLSGYMDATELGRLLDETPRVNTILAAVEAHDIDEATDRLNALPGVATVSRPALDAGLVRAEVADEIIVLSVMLAFFAAAIAVGVVYNNARIALELRSRDLATMRILGFTRGELAGVLLGEQAIEVACGILPGLVLGRLVAGLWLATVDRELLRIPLAITPASYVSAACVVALAAFVSALIVRRQSDRLDLVAVLKARD